jgi:hypothetical protein
LKKSKKTPIKLSTKVCANPTIRVLKIDEKAQKCGDDICTGITKINIVKPGHNIKYTDCPVGDELQSEFMKGFLFIEEPASYTRFENSQETTGEGSAVIIENFLMTFVKWFE